MSSTLKIFHTSHKIKQLFTSTLFRNQNNNNLFQSLSPQTKLFFSNSPTKMSKYFMISYKYVPDILEKRTPFRAEHLKLAERYASEGKLIFGGALTDPVDSAAIVFKAESKEEVEGFIKDDPYVKNGLVTEWGVREWTVVVGSGLQK